MQDQIIQWFSQYPYEPLTVYAAIYGVMMVCALGFPLPEEVVILSAGILGHMSLNPEQFPPPYEGAASVDPYGLAIACLSAVIFTDYIIFWIGRRYGKKIINSPKLHKHFSKDKVDKIKNWADKYGFWAPAIFRFIPGVRFPGHMMSGALDMPTWSFLLTDGVAALISVPTQVLLVSFYGQDILDKLKQFKIAVFIILVVVALIYGIRRYLKSRPVAT